MWITQNFLFWYIDSTEWISSRLLYWAVLSRLLFYLIFQIKDAYIRQIECSTCRIKIYQSCKSLTLKFLKRLKNFHRGSFSLHLEPLDCISVGNAAVLKLVWYLLSNYFYEDIIKDVKRCFLSIVFDPQSKVIFGLFRSSHCEFWKSFKNTYYISVRLLLLAVFCVLFRALVKQFHINVRFLDSFKMFSDVFRW